MRTVVALIAASVGLAPAPSTCDPVKLLPGSYSLQFENEWVKVVRVRYAHAKLPAHAHTSRASAYVYLNDSGPVIFRHVGEKKFAATRPATKAGSFRVFRGIDEIHEVENTSDLPSEFLRVEFKTEPKKATTLRGRFFREAAADGKNLEKVPFENAQIRITRLICASGRTVAVTTADTQPALLIDISSTIGTEQSVISTPPASPTPIIRSAGSWSPWSSPPPASRKSTTPWAWWHGRTSGTRSTEKTSTTSHLDSALPGPGSRGSL